MSTLGRSRFAKAVLAQKNITLRMPGNSQEAEFLNFDEEDCRSFLLGCRFLLQDNERVSVRNIWRLFEARIADSAWFARINPPRWKLNDYLDQDAPFAVPGGGTITNRLLLYTFLYGSYAHHNREHRERLREWEASQQLMFMKLLFLMALKVVYRCAAEMADVVSDWLASQPNATRAST